MDEDTQIQKSVLLIDDSKYLLGFYADAFRNANYSVDTALGAAEALRQLQAKTYRAVIFDVKMVAVPGLQMMEMIKRQNLAQNSVFIILTNENDPDKMKEAVTFGINNYFIKSENPPVTFVGKVNQILETKNRI